MSNFNSNKNSFLSSIQLIKSDFHSFLISGVPKGSKTSRQQKRSLNSSISSAIDEVNSEDFGIRVIIIRTKD